MGYLVSYTRKPFNLDLYNMSSVKSYISKFSINTPSSTIKGSKFVAKDAMIL